MGSMKSKLGWLFLGLILTVGVVLVVSNSEYQLGRRRADKIVAAGEELMALAQGGETVTINEPLTDRRVPVDLRLLHPGSIRFSADEVYIYTGGHAGKGFFIYKNPRAEAPVPSDCWQINS